MVRLTRIYTRGGDDGSTSLGDGRRVAKTAPRIAAIGDVDELNSAIGVVRAHGAGPHDARLAVVQNDLFDAGADLSVPAPPDEAPGERLRMGAERVARLEGWCDEVNAELPELTSFVLPAGSPAAAALHHARTVCRRAERAVVALAEREHVTPELAAYLNRLSDLLFILARDVNRDAGGDVLWRPGG